MWLLITRWSMTPADVNAYYSSSLNQMVFPSGILQPPFFDNNVPMWVSRLLLKVSHWASLALTSQVTWQPMTNNFTARKSINNCQQTCDNVPSIFHYFIILIRLPSCLLIVSPCVFLLTLPFIAVCTHIQRLHKLMCPCDLKVGALFRRLHFYVHLTKKPEHWVEYTFALMLDCVVHWTEAF